MKISGIVKTQEAINATNMQSKVQKTDNREKKCDSIQISKNGQKASRNKLLDNNANQTFNLYKMLEQSKNETDFKNEELEDYAKCLKIAKRIMNGDKVPLKDIKFISEKEPEMYMKAEMLKRINPKPKEYKSVLGDEDEEENEMEAESSEQPEINPAEGSAEAGSPEEGLSESNN